MIVSLAVTLTAVYVGTAQTTSQYIETGIAKFDAKDFVAAEAAFSACIKLDPQVLDCYYKRGLVNEQLKKFDAAVADYTSVISANPNIDAAYLRRGFAYYNLDKLDLALADNQAALKLKPGDPAYTNLVTQLQAIIVGREKLAREKAQLEIEKQKLTDAKRAVADKAEDAFALGEKYSLAQNYPAAVEVYTICLKAVPTHLKCLHSRALAYDALKNTDAAIADLTAMLKIQPDAHTYYSRSIMYRSKADYKAAALDLTEAIKLEPDSPAHYLNRGATYVLALDYKSAIPDLTQSIKLKADDARPYYMRGYSYEMTGKKALAIADYKKSLTLRPDDAVVKAALAKLTAAK